MTDSAVASSTDMPPTTPFPAAVDRDDPAVTMPVAAPSVPSTTSPSRFYMTSDLRAATGLPRTHLDFYLREGLIVPTARTESGYLLFDDAELATLRTIIRWRAEGAGIREIRARLGREA